jgi:predicted XRE-type DNA-binding protein
MHSRRKTGGPRNATSRSHAGGISRSRREEVVGKMRDPVVRQEVATGNVFRDIGFTEGEARHLRLRATLLLALQEAIARRKLTQQAAAKLLGVTQPRVSTLMRGRIDLFSADTLVDLLGRIGLEVRVQLTSARAS